MPYIINDNKVVGVSVVSDLNHTCRVRISKKNDDILVCKTSLYDDKETARLQLIDFLKDEMHMVKDELIMAEDEVRRLKSNKGRLTKALKKARKK